MGTGDSITQLVEVDFVPALVIFYAQYTFDLRVTVGAVTHKSIAAHVHLLLLFFNNEELPPHDLVMSGVTPPVPKLVQHPQFEIDWSFVLRYHWAPT